MLDRGLVAPARRGVLRLASHRALAVVAAAVLLAGSCTYEMKPIARPGVLTLSFEDGPNPGVTDELLDVLDEYRVRAYFCVVGQNVLQSREHEALVREIERRGHILVNHGGSGDAAWTDPTLDGLRADVVAGNAALSEAVGRPEPTRFYRPAGTYFEWQRGAWQGIGQSLLLADTRYGDESMDAGDADELVARIQADMDDGTAELIALHDGLGLQRTLQARRAEGGPWDRRFVVDVTRRVLEYAREKGYLVGQAEQRQRITAPIY